MAYRTNEECIACGACAPECPEQCIAEGDPICFIDAGKCTDCAGVCPTASCVPA
jgi:ferredoxin